MHYYNKDTKQTSSPLRWLRNKQSQASIYADTSSPLRWLRKLTGVSRSLSPASSPHRWLRKTWCSQALTMAASSPHRWLRKGWRDSNSHTLPSSPFRLLIITVKTKQCFVRLAKNYLNITSKWKSYNPKKDHSSEQSFLHNFISY